MREEKYGTAHRLALAAAFLGTMLTVVACGGPAFESTTSQQEDGAQDGSEQAIFNNEPLGEGVRRAIRKPKGPIYVSELEKLTSLNLELSDITDLSGIEYFTNVEKLLLMKNEVTGDMSPLASLTKLTYLDLANNEVNDVSALASLTNLSQLFLSLNKISDISPLASLTNLTWLTLENNKISDISALASCTSLTNLTLTKNQVSDISPLLSLPNLKKVKLSGNPLSDESVNKVIPQLEEAGVEVDYWGS